MRAGTLLKRVSLVIGSLLLVAILGLIGFIWFGPVAITDKGMLLKMLTGGGIAPPTSADVQSRLHVPPGFKVALFADNLPGARFLRVTSQGDLLVSLPRSGQVMWLEKDRKGEGHAGSRHVLIDNLNRPHGLDIHDDWLYVGENDAVGRVKLDAMHSATDGKYQRIVVGLTGEGNHWTKTVRIGPDGNLYLTQGSTCNVCIEQDPRRASMMRFRADGMDGQMIATGLRNSVGFDWAPWDNALYATENGRDLLGDDVPNDELNRIQPGGFYGWPYVHAFGILDPDLGKENPDAAARTISPAFGFHAHNAPLGIRFLRKPAAGFERSALVALHGSWNRSKADGYKVVSLHFNDKNEIEQRDFLTGFLTEKGAIGRPVDVTEDDDGVIYVSDDYAGTIYRVTRD